MKFYVLLIIQTLSPKYQSSDMQLKDLEFDLALDKVLGQTQHTSAIQHKNLVKRITAEWVALIPQPAGVPLMLLK